jgi:Xaa-Pro aminopeptidase
MVTPGTARLADLRQAAAIGPETAVLVAHGPDVMWSCGFTGSNGCLVFLESETILVTDGRYETQVAEECPGLQVLIRPGDALRSAAEFLQERPVAAVQVQAEHIPWSALRHIEHVLPRVEVQPLADPFPDLRAVKTPAEVAIIERALRITEQAFSSLPGILREGMTEKELAAELDHLQRQAGASGPAFETIVAFSERAALPHARPGDRPLRHGDIILIDTGCIVDGYHSDMTRMMAFGRTDKTFLEAYAAVDDALKTSMDHATAGVQGVVLDGVAREVLTRHGYGDRFTHSLGHGVGLQIHEYPSVSSRNPNPLPCDAVITLEPGVYLPGAFGIRIENMVQLTESGCTVLNTLDTRLVVL